MKRLASLAALVLVFVTAACGKDEPTLAPVPNDAVSPTTAAQDVPVLAPSNAPDATVGTTATTLSPTTLIPASAQSPAAGTCGNAVGGFAIVTLNPDIPSPRCVIAHATDQIKVVNNTDELQAVDNGPDQISLHPHETAVLPSKLGAIWQPGVHRLETTLYGDSDPEIWLK